MEILDPKLKENWKNYIWQGVFAGGSVVLIMVILGNIFEFVLIAAVGSTAFTVFAIPHSRTARIRNVMGGHSLCIIVGILGYQLNPIEFGSGLAVALGFF
ncbi:MAG: HPP family protein [Candidatus Hadarchaeia archaeon]